MLEISMGEIDEEVAVRVDEFILDVANSLVNELIDESPVFTGQLRQSWRILAREPGKYIVGSPLKHAVTVYKGQPPGTWVPIVPLKKWVRRKLHKPEEMAYAVQKKIYFKGTEPNKYIDRAIENLRQEYG